MRSFEMSEFFARYQEDGAITAGPIEGQEWRGIRENSRFWPIIEAWQDAGNTILPYAPDVPPVEIYRIAVQGHLDGKAQERQYDSGYTLASYVVSTIPAWKEEADAFVSWRDAVWVYALTELAKVEGGQRHAPSVEDLIAELPAFGWP